MIPSTPTLERMPWGRRSRFRISSRQGRGGHLPPAATELVVVDLVAQHDEQPHEELPGDRDFGFGAPTPMDEREVGAPEVGIDAGRMRRGLTEGEAEERAALLGNVTEVILVGRSIQRGARPT